MKIKTLYFYIVCVALLAFATKAQATPYGTYIGSASTNDKTNGIAVNEVIDSYNLANEPDVPSPVAFLTRYNIEGGWENGTKGFSLGFSGLKSGTWASSLYDSFYYSLKAEAGSGFVLYYVDSISLNTPYDWDTSTLSNKDLSYISFWIPKSNPVPEPATMLLFGTGLAGLAGFVRKKTKKN